MLYTRCRLFRNICIVALCGSHVVLGSILSLAATVAILQRCRRTCRFRGRFGFSADDHLKFFVATVLRLIVGFFYLGLEWREDGSHFGFGQRSRGFGGDF